MSISMTQSSDRRRPSDYIYDEVYDDAYSLKQLKKFLLRRENHWAQRIGHIRRSLELLDLTGKEALDLGTSIGTFAAELSKLGYNVTGLDVDEKAIALARRLADFHGYDVRYVVADASRGETFEACSFDLIVAEDIFEHLHDDVLKSVLVNCSHWLKKGGYVVFHTYPSRYDRMFKNPLIWFPLVPFATLSDQRFCRVVETYHNRVLNPVRKLIRGKTFEQSIEYAAHCNLLTAGTLAKHIADTGLMVLKVETENLYAHRTRWYKNVFFRNKQYYHSNITGIAWKPIA